MAGLFVRGYKPVENRPWSTHYRSALLIHAGLQLNWDGLNRVRRRCPEIAAMLPRPQLIERGGIVGVCELTNSVLAPAIKNPDLKAAVMAAVPALPDRCGACHEPVGG